MAAPQAEVLIIVAGMETARFVLTPGDSVIGRNEDCPSRSKIGFQRITGVRNLRTTNQPIGSANLLHQDAKPFTQ